MIESFVGGDKTCCIYRVPDEEFIKEHAELGRLPCESSGEFISLAELRNNVPKTVIWRCFDPTIRVTSTSAVTVN